MPTRCPHCLQYTLVTIDPGVDPSVHCTNKDCGGWFATMNYSQFKAMTAKELQERKAAKSGGFQTLDAGQAEYEARIARIIRERDELQAQREAERKPDEKRFC